MTAVRSEQRKVKALTWLLDHVELVDEDGNPVLPEDSGSTRAPRRRSRMTPRVTVLKARIPTSRHARNIR